MILGELNQRDSFWVNYKYIWNQNLFFSQTRQYIKKQRCYFASKGPYSQSYGFSSSHVWVWELDHKESWTLKNWCFWTMMLVKTLESPLDSKEIQPVHPKGDQSWVFIGRTVAKTEAPILWPPEKNFKQGTDSLEKTLMLGKIEGRRRRGRQGMRWVDGITSLMDMNLSKLWESVMAGRPGVLQSISSQRIRHDWVTELNWELLRPNQTCLLLQKF